MNVSSGLNGTIRGPKEGQVRNKDKTTCPKGHPYSGDNLIITKEGRRCRICVKATQKKYWAQWKVHHLSGPLEDTECAICGSDQDLVIDHDHNCCPGMWSCGKCVRGMLCRKCNLGIGHLRDDVTLILRAAEYILERAERRGPQQ
jgi:hypothetical protein